MFQHPDTIIMKSSHDTKSFCSAFYNNHPFQIESHYNARLLQNGLHSQSIITTTLSLTRMAHTICCCHGDKNKLMPELFIMKKKLHSVMSFSGVNNT